MKLSQVFLLAAVILAANTMSYEWRLAILLLVCALGFLADFIERQDKW